MSARLSLVAFAVLFACAEAPLAPTPTKVDRSPPVDDPLADPERDPEVGDPPNPQGPIAGLPIPSVRYRVSSGLRIDDAQNDAERAMWSMLEGHDGWPTDVSIFFPMDVPTMAAVVVVDLNTMRAVPNQPSLVAGGLRVDATFEADHTYGYALISPSIRSEEDYEPDAALVQSLGDSIPAMARVVVADRFTTSARTTPRFDVRTRAMAIPNDLLRDESGWPANLAVHEEHRAAISNYDGFSTTAPVTVAFTTAIDDVEVELVSMDGRAITGSSLRIDADEHAIQPDLPLAPERSYAAVVRGDGVQGNLQSLTLLSDVPVVTFGASRIRILADDRAERLEPHRVRLSPVRAAMTSKPVALFPFTTLAASSTLERLRNAVEGVSTAPLDIKVEAPGLLGLGLTMPSVESIVTGRIESLDVAPVDFILTIPKDRTGPMPVVLAGHGLVASRDAVETWADGLAEAGFAAFAIDLPYHGERASGLPILSSLDFIDLEDLVTTRDNFLQATIDLGQAVRVIREADWPTLIGHELDENDVVFLGTSLGGILGASLAGVEPAVRSYALNVPGANLVELILQSEQPVLAQMLSDDLERRGIVRDSSAFHRYMASAKWTMDVCDPINLVPRNGSRRLLIQMVEDDQVIPNTTTTQLAAVSGTAIETFTPPVLGHAFLANPVSPEGIRAQEQIVTFFEAR